MSEVNNNTATSPSTDVNSLGGVVNESSNSLITTVRLDGTNFLAWFQSAKPYIISKGKITYLTGEAKMPKTNKCKVGRQECYGDIMAPLLYAA